MAPFIAIVLLIGILCAFGIAAAMWGTDSRPTYLDDHAR